MAHSRISLNCYCKSKIYGTYKIKLKSTIPKQTSEDFNIALELMNKYGAIKKTRSDALQWGNIAKESLEAVPDNNIKLLLINLADYVVDRVK